MKRFLFVAGLCLLFGAKAFGQDGDARAVLLGNDPTATLTTGLGLVVKPVGTPVIQSPFAPAPAPAPATPAVGGDAGKEEKGFKEKGKYELGEVVQKKKGGDKGEAKTTLQGVPGLGGGALGGLPSLKDSYVSQPEVYGNEGRQKITVPQGPLPQAVRIPYAETPQPQRIPYQ